MARLTMIAALAACGRAADGHSRGRAGECVPVHHVRAEELGRVSAGGEPISKQDGATYIGAAA